MKKIISLLICTVMFVTAMPLYSTAAGGRSCPMELGKPTNATLTWLMRDTPTTMNFTYIQPAGVTAFVAARDRAYDEGTEEAFWASTGYDDVIITTQIDWAIDDPTDWKYDLCPEAWNGEYGFGYNSDSEYAVDPWSYTDDGWVSSETTREEWVLRGFCGKYEDWYDSVAWTGNGAYKPGLRDQLKEGQYEITEDGLVIDWEEHTAYLRVRYVVKCPYWENDEYKEDFWYSEWSDPASYGKDAVRWEPPVEGDVPAPVISNFRMTDEEFNDWPVIAYTLDVPEDFLTLVSGVTGHGGYAYVETFCRVEGSDDRWIKLYGNNSIRSGENKKDLVALYGSVEMNEYTSLELKVRYVVEVYLNEPDREYNYDLYSDYSDTLVLKGKDHEHVWSEPVVCQNPTCTEKGIEKSTCLLCSRKQAYDIDALGHDFSDWTVTVNPTCTSSGVETKVCSRCGAKEEREIAVLPHVYEDQIVEPTCTGKGYTVHTCETCGDTYSDNFIDAIGHQYGDWAVTISPTCTGKGVALSICSKCGDTRIKEIPELGHDYFSIVTDPTCSDRGYTTHTCTRCEDIYYDSFVDALGHSFGEWALKTAPTCSTNGFEERACSRCEETETREVNALGHDYVVELFEPSCSERGYLLHKCNRCGDEYADNFKNALGHDFGDWEITVAPNCTEEGESTRYCSRCDAFEKSVVDPLGHNYIFEVTEPTCLGSGFTTHTCSRCGDSYIDDEKVPLGHNFGDWSIISNPTCEIDGYAVRYCSRCLSPERKTLEAFGHNYIETVIAPSCVEQGFTKHTCSVCGHYFIDGYTDSLGHSFGEWVVTTAPACTAKGVEERFCSRCDGKETRDVDALGHTPTASVIENEKTATCAVDGSYDEVVYCFVCGVELSRETKIIPATGHNYTDEITAPTCTEKGFTVHTCKACGDAYIDSEVDALGHNFGADGNSEKCSVCGEKNPDYKPPVNFTDVKPGAYYADAVAWAVANNITAGTSATTFSPDDGCTRGQVVTFLWRAAGSPEPTGTKNPFRDVKSDAYYYKAVLWAVENGITSGTSATTFSPEDVCTRGQIVTFLWRANGKPSPTKTSNPFKDVKSDDYFYDAVLWAVENGVTTGTSATAFSPKNTCTRGQVVTFLYRYANK